MVIAILADTHDHLDNIRRACAVFRRRQVEGRATVAILDTVTMNADLLGLNKA